MRNLYKQLIRKVKSYAKIACKEEITESVINTHSIKESLLSHFAQNLL